MHDLARPGLKRRDAFFLVGRERLPFRVHSGRRTEDLQSPCIRSLREKWQVTDGVLGLNQLPFAIGHIGAVPLYRFVPGPFFGFQPKRSRWTLAQQIFDLVGVAAGVDVELIHGFTEVSQLEF